MPLAKPRRLSRGIGFLRPPYDYLIVVLGLRGRTITRDGPRLADLEVMASTECAPIPRV